MEHLSAAEFTQQFPSLSRICKVADPELAGCVWYASPGTYTAEIVSRNIPDELVEEFFVEDGDDELNARLGDKVGLSALGVNLVLRAVRFAGGA